MGDTTPFGYPQGIHMSSYPTAYSFDESEVLEIPIPGMGGSSGNGERKREIDFSKKAEEIVAFLHKNISGASWKDQQNGVRDLSTPSPIIPVTTPYNPPSSDRSIVGSVEVPSPASRSSLIGDSTTPSTSPSHSPSIYSVSAPTYPTVEILPYPTTSSSPIQSYPISTQSYPTIEILSYPAASSSPIPNPIAPSQSYPAASSSPIPLAPIQSSITTFTSMPTAAPIYPSISTQPFVPTPTSVPMTPAAPIYPSIPAAPAQSSIPTFVPSASSTSPIYPSAPIPTFVPSAPVPPSLSSTPSTISAPPTSSGISMESFYQAPSQDTSRTVAIDIPTFRAYPSSTALQAIPQTFKRLPTSMGMNYSFFEVQTAAPMTALPDNERIPGVTKTKRTSRKTETKRVTRSIMPDLIKLPLTEEERNMAEKIFKGLDLAGTRRNGKRSKLLFFCISKARHELKSSNKDPKEIARMLGMPPGDMSGAYSTYRPIGEKGGVSQHVSPIDLIAGFCRGFSLEEGTIKDVEALCEEILDKEPELTEHFPSTVAAGVISFFFEIRGIKVTKTLFREVVKLSEVTVNSAHAEIRSIYNRDDSVDDFCDDGDEQQGDADEQGKGEKEEDSSDAPSFW